MKDVTVRDMLLFREEKVRIQSEMRKEYGDAVIAALGMNVPGPKKISPEIVKAFQEGGRLIASDLRAHHIFVAGEREVIKKEGCLKIFAIKSQDALLVKKITINIEETHPLGRLFDIDVYDENGLGINREELGVLPRKCLLCDQDAKTCGRSRSHTTTELYERVQEIIRNSLNKF